MLYSLANFSTSAMQQMTAYINIARYTFTEQCRVNESKRV